MAAKSGLPCVGVLGLLLISVCARADVGPSVPTPSLKQELDEGIAAWFLVAASSVTLSYDQQQLLITVRQEVSAQSSLVNAARQKLVGQVADGVASGTFDDKAIAATMQEMVAAAEARGPAVLDALNRLHAGLTPDQRKSMAQTIAQGIPSDATQTKTEREQLQRRVDSLTANVGLTRDQTSRVKTDILDAYKQFAPELNEEATARQKQLGGLSQGFAQFYFQPSLENVRTAWDLEAKSKRLIAFARTLSGILNPNQRAQVANLIRERVNYG